MGREFFNSRNFAFILLFAVCTICFTYSNVTKAVWTHLHIIQKTAYFSAERKPYFSTSGVCPIDWKNSELETSEYEEDTFKVPAVSFEELPPSVPVNPIYPNPIFKLRRDYFVLPLLQNGPNNQLVGFREAIYLAIKLNRTVVLPKFFRHHTDKNSSRLASPEHRLRVLDLCNFVSCVTLQQFREACGYRVDGVLYTRDLNRRYRSYIQSHTGMKLVEIPTAEKSQIDYPLIPTDPIKTGNARHYRGFEIPKIFSSEAKCIIFPRPLYNLHTIHSSKRDKIKDTELIKNVEELESGTEKQLQMTIAYHTRSPKYISNIAQDFIKRKMGGQPYISVHWRYQPHEFMRRCFHGTLNNPVKRKICTNAKYIDSSDIAAAVEKKILSVGNKEIRRIYFATPASERNILTAVATTLHERHGWWTFSSLDLEKFMEEQFLSCPDLRNHFNDILSTTEMEMCVYSDLFLGSLRSSWSEVVHRARKTSPEISSENDGDIFLSSLEAAKQRLGDKT